MKYRVTFEIFASTTVTVEADNEEQAREKACKKSVGSHGLQMVDVGEIIDVAEAVESKP